MGCGLRLLWLCQPDHPLCDVFDNTKSSTELLQLRWLLSWEEIHETHDGLDKYAENIWKLIEHPEQPRQHVPLQKEIANENTLNFGLFNSREAAEQMLSSRMQEMSIVPENISTDSFITDFNTLYTTLQSSTSTPLLSLIAQNSFTHALELQSNFIRHALLSLFFNSLNIRKHLSTLHSYLLLGDGMFVTRLHEALFEDFDTEDVRSGGQSGLGLGIGILNSKSSWPPNGAKVGLVLRTILAETHHDGATKEISFAYRELTEEQFEKVKNPIGKPL